jgi:four helix bundle protein
MKIQRFEELNIWKLSLLITRIIYDLSAKPNFARDFGLRDQIRRAVISISSNIVEGFEKNNNNEFVRFLKIAKGSVGEVRNRFILLWPLVTFPKLNLTKLTKNWRILQTRSEALSPI